MTVRKPEKWRVDTVGNSATKAAATEHFAVHDSISRVVFMPPNKPELTGATKDGAQRRRGVRIEREVRRRSLPRNLGLDELGKQRQ